MPIGILGSLLICTVLYILMSLTMTGLAPYTSLNVAYPVFVAIDNAGPQLAWLGFLVNVGAVVGPRLRRPRAAARPVAHLLRHVARRL